MVSDLQDQDWPDDYKEKCLEGKVPAHKPKASRSGLAGHFTAATDGIPVTEVDHFLLRLAKRD